MRTYSAPPLKIHRPVPRLAAHGAQKLFGVLGGSGLRGTARYLESLGLRPGRPLAIAAGLTELAGGLLLAAGAFTPLAATLIGSTMLVAALTEHSSPTTARTMTSPMSIAVPSFLVPPATGR